MPATFFVITGPIKGSRYAPDFVGRPVDEILADTKTIPTSENNFFERASASLYLGFSGTLDDYNRADELYESGKKEMAYKVMDSLYKNARKGNLKPGKDLSMEMAQEEGLTWPYLKEVAENGYEIASHTVTHAHLAILDTANMGYELRKSKEEIRTNLGDKYTFSAEIPFGVEDPRVMKNGFPVYEALRNSMPDSWMKEINRGYKDKPGKSDKEYVQWQRGPLSKTSVALMKSWVDTSLAHSNIWLVLVIHGIDDVGWEPISHENLQEYFSYIKNREDNIWIATFGDVARYVRERMHAQVNSGIKNNKIAIHLTQTLDNQLYNEPLTLKTYIPSEWKKVKLKINKKKREVKIRQDEYGKFILYEAVPDEGTIEVSGE